MNPQNSEIRSDGVDRKNQDQTQEACGSQGQADAFQKIQKAAQTLRLVDQFVGIIGFFEERLGARNRSRRGWRLCYRFI
jgi:hypothetical protein